jgi:hypothetical protein
LDSLLIGNEKSLLTGRGWNQVLNTQENAAGHKQANILIGSIPRFLEEARGQRWSMRHTPDNSGIPPAVYKGYILL